jgi:hypothetical protein
VRRSLREGVGPDSGRGHGSAADPERGSPTHSGREPGQAEGEGIVSAFAYWTAADAAEADVMAYELARHGAAEHRATCAACRPCPIYEDWRAHLALCRRCQDDAPVTFGGPCERRAEFIAHGHSCLPCNPCRTLTKLAEIAVDWRDRRVLRSKAEWLRRLENEREGEAA